MYWYRFLTLSLALVAVSISYSQTFTNVTGTGAEIGGNKDGGAVWGDFDNDGDLDLLINTSQNNTAGRTRLLQSDGAANPSFTDVTNTLASGINDVLADRSIIWGDLNNDGNLDFVRNTFNRVEIYINRGTTSTPNYMFGVGAGMTPNYTFRHMVRNGCSRGDGMNVEGVAFLDYNNDGWMDMILENGECGIDVIENMQQDATATINVTFDDGTSNNDTEATTNGFFHHISGTTTGFPLIAGNGDFMSTGDYDGDGYVDVIARKPTGTSVRDLWKNDGDGTFSANTSIPDDASTNAANANKGGVIFCDFDSDGDLDLYWSDGGTNQIWLQTSAENFVATAKPTLPSNDIDGCACADVDGDGDIDMFLGSGAGNSYLYINTTSSPNSVADLSFTRTDIAVNANCEGVNLVDYDDDGDYDIYINVNGANNQIWENDLCDLGTCDFLRVFIEDCIDGTMGTRPVVGAEMVIKDDMGNIVAIGQSGSTAAGHGAQNPPSAIFYLPDMTSDYTIDITFPEKNGTVETYSYTFDASTIVDNTLTLTAVNGTNGSSCDFSVLPIVLESFEANNDDEGIRLDWVTSSELNNEYFEIQRSSDGLKFQKIGAMDGRGTTDVTTTYSFLDGNPGQGVNYYRLKQYDFSGEFSYSRIVAAFHNMKEELAIFPNPATDYLSLYFGDKFSRTEVSLTLISSDGKVIWENQVSAPQRELRINLSSPPRGTFLLQISNQYFQTSRQVKFR